MTSVLPVSLDRGYKHFNLSCRAAPPPLLIPTSFIIEMIEKFTIPELDKTELQSKLSDIRYPNELQDDSVGWKYGTPTWAVKDMVDYWKTSFSWEKSRDEINRWHHYQTPINDLNIHFIHEPSAQESSIPIILLHGWPSTFYEFHKIINPLRDHPTQVMHVINIHG